MSEATPEDSRSWVHVAASAPALTEYTVHMSDGEWHIMRRFRVNADKSETLVEEHKILLTELEA